MAPTPEGLKKASEAAAKGATTTASKAGATTTKFNAGAGASSSTAAKSATKPANKGSPATTAKSAASTSSSSNAGAATASPRKDDPTSDATPDWKALRAKVAENSPKVQGEVITGDPVALLKFLRARQNEQALTTYAAYPKRSICLDRTKKNGTVPVPK